MDEGRELVYRWGMARTNVDFDAEVCDGVTKRYRLRTKCDAVNLSGGDGDLEIARGSRAA
jgi:Arc/MetJ family transcription regulator